MARSKAPAGHRALLSAAREEFALHGYAGTSIRAIAQRAGMSLSVLYHYYTGKQELLQAIIDESLDAYFAVCEEELAAAGEGPVERLGALVTATVRFRASNPARSNLMQREEHGLDPAYVEHFAKRVRDARRMFQEVVEAGVAAGLFRTPYPDDARRAVEAMCNAISQWYDPRGELTVEEIAARYRALALVIVEYGEP